MISRMALVLALLGVVSATTSIAGDEWVVRMDGVGPVKIGTSLHELNTALHEKFALPDDKEDQDCFFVDSTKHAHFSFMIIDGHVARIDVDGRGIRTSAGIQVGDSEAYAVKVYGGNMKVEPNAYTGPDDHYLTILSSDGLYGLRFETENGKIKTFYVGTSKAIQYMEGCE